MKQELWNEIDLKTYEENARIITSLNNIAESLKRVNLRIQSKYQHLPKKPLPEAQQPHNLVR